MTEFFQTGPQLTNTYANDFGLRLLLQQYLPEDIFATVQPLLQQLGERAAHEMPMLAAACESNQPRHIAYDPWGRRLDQIKVDSAWDKLKDIAAEEGIVATGYERRYSDSSRLLQMALLYLYHPSSAIFSCPLAMTDGAARAIELYGDDHLKQNAYTHLTSRDPKQFWTSGQWMTERTGGSDVRTSQTRAIKAGRQWQLYGTKWFTSATTSEMAMTLARPEGDDDLSLFYLEMRNADHSLNNLQIHRLKDKLGTKALPTAELTLNGTLARMVGGQGKGIRKISSLFNITRIYNAVCAIGSMRRALDLANDYAHKRIAFGRRLIDQPLHLKTLADLELRFRACKHLVFYVANLLGKDECDTDLSASPILRLLTPVTKLFTAKEAIAVVSEVLECFGGAGYVEDTGLPVMLRDVQVLSIWEGTTNVLSLDLLRAMAKEAAFEPFVAAMNDQLNGVSSGALVSDTDRLKGLLKQLQQMAADMAKSGPELAQLRARDFAFFVAHIAMSCLLLQHADWQLKQNISHADAAILAAKWQIDRTATFTREGHSYSQDDLRTLLNLDHVSQKV